MSTQFWRGSERGIRGCGAVNRLTGSIFAELNALGGIMRVRYDLCGTREQ